MVSASDAGHFGDGGLICATQGLAFGSPRSAKENAALRSAMKEVR